jgi:hypothetical protein
MTLEIRKIDVSVQQHSFAEFRPIQCASLYGEYQRLGRSCMEEEMKDFPSPCCYLEKGTYNMSVNMATAIAVDYFNVDTFLPASLFAHCYPPRCPYDCCVSMAGERIKRQATNTADWGTKDSFPLDFTVATEYAIFCLGATQTLMKQVD